MYELYFEKFAEKVVLAYEEKEFIKKRLSIKKLRKRQFLLQEGDIAHQNAFVEKGLLRLYQADEDGMEHIVFFAHEGTFITDLYSFLKREPSEYCIDAIEDSELVVISREARDELIEQSSAYLRYMLHVLSEFVMRFQDRITSSISMTPDERFKYLLDTCPGILLRVPQHMIASFMGMAPETLSRVKHRMAAK